MRFSGWFPVALFAALGPWQLQAQQSVATQPFGLRFGTSLAEVQEKLRATPFTGRFNGWFRLSAPPIPSGLFTSFQLFVSPRSGLCKIVAISSPIESGPDGAEARRVLSAVRDSLDRVYGSHTQLESVASNPEFTGADEWMQSLNSGERTLRVIWYEDPEKFPPGLAGVSLKLAGVSRRAAELVLSIDHEAHLRCVDEVIEAERAGRQQ